MSHSLTPMVIILILIFITALGQPRLLQAYEQALPVIVDVGPDGYVTVTHRYVVSAEEAPLTLVAELLVSEPDYILATLNKTLGILIETAEGRASLTVPGPGDVEFVYGTDKLTSKQGDVWSLALQAPYPVRIILPEDAVIINVEGNLLDAGKTPENRDYLDFDPGAVAINYMRAPGITITTTTTPLTTTTTPPPTTSPTTTTTPSSSTTPIEIKPGAPLWKYGVLAAILVVVVAAILFFRADKTGA